MKRALPWVAALLGLSGCATVDHRLPWTADNVQAVARKCGLKGLTVNTTSYGGSGLSALGEEPPIFKNYRCLERHIQVPARLLLYTG